MKIPMKTSDTIQLAGCFTITWNGSGDFCPDTVKWKDKQLQFQRLVVSMILEIEALTHGLMVWFQLIQRL